MARKLTKQSKGRSGFKGGQKRPSGVKANIPGKPCGQSYISSRYNCSPEKSKIAREQVKGSQSAKTLANRFRKYKGLSPLTQSDATKKYETMFSATRKIKDPGTRLLAAERNLTRARKQAAGKRVAKGNSKAAARTGAGTILAKAKKEFRLAQKYADSKNPIKSKYENKPVAQRKRATTAGESSSAFKGTKWSHISID